MMSDVSYSSLTSSQSPVFAGEKGKAWRFFVEATAVRGRPTLIRKITKNGGSVVNSAREADILLAESNTKEALELFEAWCGDKILLSTRWVGRCLEAHAFLGSDRGWGGCEFTREVLLQGILVSDDGSDAEEEEVSQNPEPSRRTIPSSQTPKTSPSKPLSEPGPSHLRSTLSPNQSHKISSKTEQVIEQNPANIPANIHNFAPQSSGKGPLHVPRNSTLPMDSSLQASLPHTPTTLQQQQQALFATMFGNLIQPSQQPLSPDMFSPLSQYSNLSQIPLFVPSLQQILAQQFAVNPLALQSRPPELAEQSGLGSTGPQLPGSGIPSGSTQGLSTHPTPEVVDMELISDAVSVRSEEGEVELSISRKRGGKGQATSDSSSDREVRTAIRNNPPHSKEHAPEKLTGIFVNGQGKSQQFYVMVDIKNRKDLLKIIRRHNGAIVSQMKDADFIILNNRSNQFQKALDLLPNHKLAISPTWLEECESIGKMAEMSPHVIDVTSGVGRGALRRKPTPVKARLSIPEDCESEDDAYGCTIKHESPIKVLPTINPHEGNMSTTPRARSQSPLPPTNIVPAPQGNFFTEEDRIWFFKYARFKLKHDPYMSQTALINAITHKAPHHTVKSWSNTVRTKWSDEMEALKREVVTLYGQTSKAVPLPSSSTTPRDAQTELMYPETSPTPMPSQSNPSLPSRSSSTPSSSQAESTSTTTLKRKEPVEDQVGVATMDQQNKKTKTKDEAIDLDAYLDVWGVPV